VIFVRKRRFWLGLAVLVGAIALGYGAWSAVPPAPERSRPPVVSSTAAARRITAGVRLPRIHSATDAQLEAGDEVVGIVVNGRARAYRVQTMAYMMNHVLNDLIDGRPVTVTYCDKSDCVLVLTDDDRAEPLAIDIGGTREGLFLFVDGEAYAQKTGLSATKQQPLPFEKAPFERTTWGEWRRKHPGSEVYEGP